MERNDKAVGRKLFCAALPKQYEDNLITALVRDEYEVYSVKDLELLNIVTQRFPRSVLFLYTDMSETETLKWENQIIFIHDGLTTSTFLGHPAVGLGGGFTNNVKEFIFGKLESLHSKGQRRYVRFGGTDDVNVSFYFSLKGKEYTGFVYDISSAGMSCAFDKETELELNSFIDHIALTLEGVTYTITGKILLQRWLNNEKRLFVLMFDRRMPVIIREVIQDFIHSSLQAKMNSRLARPK